MTADDSAPTTGTGGAGAGTGGAGAGCGTLPIRSVTTPDAPLPAGAYSQGAAVGGLLCTAGFGPQDPRTGAVAETVGEQTAQVMRNIAAVLAAHGMSFENVVKTTVHLADLHRDFREFDAAYRDFVTPPYPARTTVGSELMDILVEIDVLAVRPG